jgi:transposase
LSLTLPPSAKIYLSLAPCDMRKGFDGLSALVRNILQLDPFSGAVFLFRGKRGDRLKALVWDGSGLCLYAKRFERGKFVWPRTQDGAAARLSGAQLAMLIEGLDWRQAIIHDEVPVPTLA